MKRETLDSSSVAQAGYDPKRRILEVLFTTGGLYEYLEVPPKISAAFMAAESPGQFLNTKIKGRFAYRRVTGRQLAVSQTKPPRGSGSLQ